MRQSISQQKSFDGGFIDASFYKLDEALERVDELLSNPGLLKFFERVFDESVARRFDHRRSNTLA